MPAFNAAAEIDFDGKNKWNKDIVEVLREEAPNSEIAPVPVTSTAPQLIRKLERIADNGEFIEIPPIETWTDATGKRITQYTILPGWATRWSEFCPANGNWSLKDTYAWEPAKGGHAHNNPSPPLLVFSDNPSQQPPPIDDFAYTPSPINFPVLQGNTYYYYWILYPIFGTRLVEWTEAWGACVSKREDWTDVKVPNLVALSTGTGYVLVGTTTHHPENHYVTAEFKTKLVEIGKKWNETCSKSDTLKYNDMSLIWGGKFDLDKGWGANPKESHSGHRFGNNADVSKKWVRKGNRAKLVKMMCDYAQVHSEGDAEFEPNPHYHLTLKTSKHPEDFPDPLDERYMDCCLSPGVPVGCIDLESNGSPQQEVLPVGTDCP